MKSFFPLLILLVSFSTFSQNKILPKEIQIKTAVLAAPEADRAEATVFGYDTNGNLVKLREGTNTKICIADDPNFEGIQVSCYSDKLEPFMARGRELRAQGKSEMEKRNIRKAEVESGKLKMPENPSALFVYSGSEENYDPSTGELKDGKFRYVVYIPYATAASTGLPEKPEAPGMPWIMDPGTHRAHIMYSPPKKD